MVMVLGLALPYKSFAADGDISIDAHLAQGYTQGQTEAMIIAKVRNTTDTAISKIKLELDTGQIPSGVDGINPSREIEVSSLGPHEMREFAWTVDITGVTLGHSYSILVTARWTDGGSDSKGGFAKDTTTLNVEPTIDDNKGQPNLPPKADDKKNYNVNSKLEVVVPQGGLNAGATTNIKLNVTNNGNARFSNVSASIVPGEKMTLKNASVEQKIGNIDRGATGSASFPIFIESSHPGGNTPITFNVKGTDPEGKEATFAITEYVTVNAGTSLADRLEIVNIQNPANVATDQNFNLKFAVKNNSSSTAKNIKVTVEPTAPIVNKTKNIFVVTLAGGESKAFDVQMFAVGGGELQSQNYPIKITAETSGTDASSIVQYTGVFVNAGDNNKNKTVPQIIITNYNYGSSAVVANEVFPLSIVLKNTNTGQTLRNIKVSFTADEGIFIPHNTSNSFYIDKIGPGASLNKTVEFMTKPDAPEKTVSINVDMSYEDSKGNPVSVKDIISVPVIQQRRLVIDDIVPTDQYFVGEQGNLSVQYYNMGKNTLNNLVIHAEGDFDFPQSTKIFAGKFDAGKSDIYDLQFIPKKIGDTSGKLIFTFEDSNGKPITIEKPFTITAQEPMPEEPMMDEEMMQPEGGGKGKYIAIGAGALVVVAAIVIYRKRKKKQLDSLDIGNE